MAQGCVTAYTNWWDDPAGRVRRIWLWWRIRVYEVQEFTHIPLALRLVALVQPSSCGIERVFSRTTQACPGAWRHVATMF